MDYMEQYKKWLDSPALSQAERLELEQLADDRKEIESRFFAPLEFGTAGLRGVMGMGLRRMNIYTVRQATQGLAELIKSNGAEACRRGAAICNDCRNMSREFAEEAARVLAGNGINVRIFDGMRPTPELSFAIRHYGCIAGINITASHNTKEYNGYKVYWEDGAQLPPAEAAVVAQKMSACDIFDGAVLADFDRAVSDGLISYMGDATDRIFLDRVQSCAVNPQISQQEGDRLKIVYTPFHGTGYRLVPEILSRAGFKNVLCVDSQMITDGNFPTVKSPNPENPEGFYLAVELAEQNDADVIIGTDPDADRIGVMARGKDGKYHALTGNQTGVLLLNYIITQKEQRAALPKNAAAIKTIVTTDMARAVCEKHGVKCFDTFTGFKFMAEKIKQFEKDGSFKYIFAYEESYGYLVGDHARDKDAVTASMLVAEAAAHYASRGMTLIDAMDELYEQYGYYREKTINLVMPGIDGLKNMAKLMQLLRDRPLARIGDFDVARMRDYKGGTIYGPDGKPCGKTEIAGSNVLYLELAEGGSFIVRPSGTEPKIKIYILIRGDNAEDAASRVQALEDAARQIGAMV